jgi:signal recognition particle subunit SRP54
MNQVSDKQMMEAEKSMSKMKEMVELMTEEERSDPDLVAGSPEIQERIAKESGNELEAVKSMVNQFLAVRKQMVDFSKMMSAKQELAGLVGEDGLQNIQGLPSEIMNQSQVGRKVTKGKVLRKRIKSKTAKPAKGFGKK